LDSEQKRLLADSLFHDKQLRLALSPRQIAQEKHMPLAGQILLLGVKKFINFPIFVHVPTHWIFFQHGLDNGYSVHTMKSGGSVMSAGYPIFLKEFGKSQ
jgi:hypothetical protein